MTTEEIMRKDPSFKPCAIDRSKINKVFIFEELETVNISKLAEKYILSKLPWYRRISYRFYWIWQKTKEQYNKLWN